MRTLRSAQSMTRRTLKREGPDRDRPNRLQNRQLHATNCLRFQDFTTSNILRARQPRPAVRPALE
jgi:hypothetical protein